MVSRVTPVVLPDMVGAKMPQFKVWTKEDEEKVKRQCLCLMDEEGETLCDLYLVDDDTLILSQGLLEGLDEELDQFLRQLMATE